MSEQAGGPAFPSLTTVSEWNENAAAYIAQKVPVGGMSLRDYFAGQALVGLALATCIAKGELLEPDVAGSVAYKFADAMLKAREA